VTPYILLKWSLRNSY